MTNLFQFDLSEIKKPALKTASFRLSPVKHFNYMPTKFSFNEVWL
jgi:hypothetical protein